MPTALIAGAGIAGGTAALGLARAGWSVTVFERAPQLGEVGAGLQVSPNAARVLEWLGVFDAVSERAFRPAAACMRDGETGAEVFRTSLGPDAQARWGAPYLHVHRADLLAALIQGATQEGAEIRTGTPVQHGMDCLIVDDKRLSADLILAADGIRSTRLRTNPRFTGQTAWRALVPASAVPGDLVPPEATVWAGDGRHVVTYYLRGGELINIVAVAERPDWTDEGWALPGNADAMRKMFQGWHIAPLLDAVEDCFLWGLFDRPARADWVTGNVARIGDAAHPMLPFMAQGAAMALEDVAALVRHLAAPVDQALPAWQTERFPRARDVTRTAQSNARLFHHAPGPLRWMARTPLQLATAFAPDFAASQLDWLYGYDAVKGRV